MHGSNISELTHESVTCEFVNHICQESDEKAVAGHTESNRSASIMISKKAIGTTDSFFILCNLSQRCFADASMHYVIVLHTTCSPVITGQHKDRTK